MENEDLDLDVKPAGNKDLWLFLILIDMVLLCVFGFFVYQRLSISMFHTGNAETGATVTEELLQEETVDKVISIAAEPETVPAPIVPQEEVRVAEVKPAPQEEMIAVAQAEIQAVETPVQEAVADVTQAQPEAQPEAQAPTEQKESVTVAVNPKSKYRRVTFRWFGDAEQVQIVSGFTMSKPQALSKKKGHWETTLSILPGTYKFLFIVDGVKQKDPYSAQKDGRSLVVIE